MAAWTLWVAIAAVLVAAELLTGTFMLLVIALAFAAGGLLAWSGASLPVQFLAASVVGVVGTVLLRRFRRRPAPAANVDIHLDIGQRVFVDGWNTASKPPTARVTYRDSPWDAELAAGSRPEPGYFVIRGIRGNRLTLSNSPA